MKKLFAILIILTLFGCNSHKDDLAYYKKNGKYARGGHSPRTYYYVHIKPDDICEVCLGSKKHNKEYHRKSHKCQWHPLEHFFE